MTDVLKKPLQFVKGVGPYRASVFAEAGLHVLEDLLLRLPTRYEARDRLQPISSLKVGDVTSSIGVVLSVKLRPTRRRGFSIFEVIVADKSCQVRAVFLNQPFLKDVFHLQQRIVLFGKVEQNRSGSGLQFTNPHYELMSGDVDADDDERVHTGRIIPVYEKLGPLTSKMLRRIVHTGLKELPSEVSDPLPLKVRTHYLLPARRQAFMETHFPGQKTSMEELNAFKTPAQRCLIFEEFFVFQLGLAVRRLNRAAVQKPRAILVNDRIRKAALKVLPFRLTGDQKQALKEVVEDLCRKQPMNRMLQGDVGSGKTIVALLAALVAMENDLQVAVMSPTEILAEQHYFSISKMLETSRFKVVFLSGGMSVREKREAWDLIASGAAQLVVGTHALVQDAVKFKKLGFVIIDEQHRFGVLQRATLRSKGLQPDVLVMTATPIPRTLALTAYGDLDVSVIRELPPGRLPIKTRIFSESSRSEVYNLLRSQLLKGRQVYVVCPLVEESEKLDVKDATKAAEQLKEIFSDYRVGLVHGRMKSNEREKIMQRFNNRKIDLLVATTVVEVGVDVANASVMAIEHAERFGLSQLHQLRGRVGRGVHQSYCVLLYKGRLPDLAYARLSAVEQSTDGFEIAERDLELRGPGDFFGTRQSGIPILRAGDLFRDYRIMEEARSAASSYLKDGVTSDNEIKEALFGWSERFGLVGVG